jgi:hypothetical protein
VLLWFPGSSGSRTLLHLLDFMFGDHVRTILRNSPVHYSITLTQITKISATRQQNTKAFAQQARAAQRLMQFASFGVVANYCRNAGK